jgi:hypothetical protein
MGRAKRNYTCLLQCKTCGKHVKNIKRHLAQTQCSSLTILKSIQKDSNAKINKLQRLATCRQPINNPIIGMNIDYDAGNPNHDMNNNHVVDHVDTQNNNRPKRQGTPNQKIKQQR